MVDRSILQVLAVLGLFCNASASILRLKELVELEEKKIYSFSIPKLQSFSWSNCGGNALKVTNLTLSPDPLSFPGTLNVAVQFEFMSTVQAPLPANVLIEKEILGEWIKIPCVDSVGSCSYQDICAFLEEVTCPDPLVKAGIPCKCPFKPANYALPSTGFNVGVSLPSGGYHIKGSLNMNGTMAACLDLHLSIS